ncbi:MAG: hypothetical protein KME13_23950 [Myxacorys californica WJT36-NPBG1]|nr:hypothetical protein [Myxacorys californica WJT36-NPBG1]
MKSLEPDFPKKNWTDLLPYEVKGSNKSELVCAAVSPDDAIDQFRDAFPDAEFYEIQCLQPEKELQKFQRGQWVATSAGDRVMVLRSRLIQSERHYETNLEPNGWLPESELMEGIAA